MVLKRRSTGWSAGAMALCAALFGCQSDGSGGTGTGGAGGANGEGHDAAPAVDGAGQGGVITPDAVVVVDTGSPDAAVPAGDAAMPAGDAAMPAGDMAVPPGDAAIPPPDGARPDATPLPDAFVPPPQCDNEHACPPNAICQAGVCVLVEGDPCALPADPGPCEAAIQRFFFDTATGQCEPFIYGGCQGNANNFETLQACQATCGGQMCPDPTDPAVHYVSQDPGVCARIDFGCAMGQIGFDDPVCGCGCQDVGGPPPVCAPGEVQNTTGACVPLCHSDQECVQGQACNASTLCLSDPACPMCDVCVGYCEATVLPPPPPPGCPAGTIADDSGACVPLCHGDPDCPAGAICNASTVCRADPGCPMCAVCVGWCTPAG